MRLNAPVAAVRRGDAGADGSRFAVELADGSLVPADLVVHGAGRGPDLDALDLSAADLVILDRYEEVPQLYTRETVEAIASSGEKQRCWVYMPTRQLKLL